MDNLSGHFEAGTSTAILGPSGSGKTTLLNFLAARMRESGTLELKGKLFMNGRNIKSIRKFKHRFSYVMQHDILWEDMTPQEQLLYTAKLAGIPDAQKKVDRLIHWLGLDKCRDTRVGNPLKRGLSGGEQKRTSIAMEVITQPSLIFLDEPTTGLDSKSALDVAGILKMLAGCGRTIITTIHQPSSEIMNRFDRVLCLCEGRIIYDGPPHNIPTYFKEIGYPPPALTNPADHLMTILNDDDIKIKALKEGRDITKEQVRDQFEKRLNHFVGTYNQHFKPIPKKECNEDEWKKLQINPNKASFCSHLCLLLGRNYLYFFRNPKSFMVKIMQAIVFALFTIVLYNNMKDPKEDTVAAIQDRAGFIFNASSTMGFAGVFASLYGIIPLIGTFFRDHEKRLYSPSLFYIISTLYHIPTQVIVCLLYELCFFFIVDMKQTTEAFFQYYLIFFCVYLAASGFGDILSISIRKIEIVTQAFPLLVVPLFMASGLLAVVKDMVFYMVGLSYISFFKFGFQAGAYIEFDDSTRQSYIDNCIVRPSGCYSSSCAIKGKTLPVCDPRQTLDFYEDGFMINIYFLLGQAVIYRIIALIIWTVYTKDKPLPYREELPPKDSFKEPKMKGNKSKLNAVNPVGKDNYKKIKQNQEEVVVKDVDQ